MTITFSPGGKQRKAIFGLPMVGKALRMSEQMSPPGFESCSRVFSHFLQPLLIRTTCYCPKQNYFLKDEIDRPVI